MSEVRVKMNATHASSAFILETGKTYLIPREAAEALCAAGSGIDGKPAATAVGRGGKVTRPTKPDPGEKAEDTESKEE